jgi:lipid II:glycine glycyltransferase (peptidoglycan interpeptide bridge formation enzyme)
LKTRDAIDIFYSLHCRTRRRHGLPPQPARFFHRIHRTLIEAGLGFVSLARFGGQWIAGAVYFHFGSRSIYKFGASDPAFQHLRANNLLMWQAICELRKAGITEISLGRSDPRDGGLLQFKRGWGGEETLLPYHRIWMRKQPGVRKTQEDSSQGLSHKVVRHLPLPILRLLGSVMYRHVG